MNIVDRPLLKETKYFLIGFGLAILSCITPTPVQYYDGTTKYYFNSFHIIDFIFFTGIYGGIGFLIGRYVDKRKRKKASNEQK
jgi:hypothetical protein